ncbi:hypothetical protein H8L32_21525 [Undibacterium sp. CY18W]|uniref:Uncharacterized protein n=1 Tax=Undibacterium hunanense TaxID=2762292 RepID=A0ABR6ZW09_9BURK|nr:hypothetical protein [Undibacterium hunanense]MBC3920062.1 hypothetical protein [Undibacterium hunanense]
METNASSEQYFPTEALPRPLTGAQELSGQDTLDQAVMDEPAADEELPLVMKQHFERYIDLLIRDERNLLRSALASVKKDGLEDLRLRMIERAEFFKRTVRLGQLLGLISIKDARVQNERFAHELHNLQERFEWYSQILTSPDSIDFSTKRKMRLKFAFSDLMN